MIQFAPIVLFAYNRSGHLLKTLIHLAQAKGASESNLWIFCDGPKPNADISEIEAVRAVAHDGVWHDRFKSVRIEVSDVNKGLARSVIGGVNAVMEDAGRAIVVEDDLLVSPDFLMFMNDCLDFFAADDTVGSITGFSPLEIAPAEYTHDVMAIPRNSSHGWATWADRWREVDWEARDAAQIWSDSALRRRFNAAGNDRADRLRRQLSGKIDSWSIRFGLWQTLCERCTIYPVHNRVHNIGFDDSGIHTRAGQELNAHALSESRPYRLEFVTENASLIRRVARAYAGPFYAQVLRDVRYWLLSMVRR